jgi:hypothetical protein
MKVASWLTCITTFARNVHIALPNAVRPRIRENPDNAFLDSHVPAFAIIPVIGIPALFIRYGPRIEHFVSVPHKAFRIGEDFRLC